MVADRHEQQQICKAKLARLTEALVGMITTLSQEQTTIVQRATLTEPIDQRRQFDLEIIACNSYDKLAGYQVLAVKDLRACHAGKLLGLEKIANNRHTMLGLVKTGRPAFKVES